MSSGGGNQGETLYKWNPYMENMWAGGVNEDGSWNPGLLGRAVNTLNTPYQSYGNRLADFTGDQNTAFGGIRYLATQGSDVGNAGSNQIKDTFAGRYQNPFSDGVSGPRANSYIGENPYFKSQVDRALGDVTEAYKTGTAANTNRMFARSGAFGGSAHQQAVEQDEKGLGDALANLSNQMYSGQYERSAGLDEADIGRRLQTSMFNANLGSGNWENERQRQVGLVPQAFAAENQGFQRYSNLLNIGNQQQRQGQMGLDLDYEDWANSQNWERQNVNWLANLLAQAQGGIGGQASQTSPGYGINPLAGLLGAGALYNAWGG